MESESRRAGAILLVALVLKVGWIVLLGPHRGADTDNYMAMAAELLGRHDPARVFPLTFEALYRGYPAFVAPFLALWGGSASFFSVVAMAQATVSAISVALLHRSLSSLTGRRGLALGVSAAYCLNPEILLWDRTLTTDSVSLSVIVVSSCFVVRALASRRFNLGLLWLAVALVMRPTNLVYVSISVWALAGLASRPRAARTATLLVVVAAALALLVRARRFDMPVGETFLATAEAGFVIDDRPAYDVSLLRGAEAPGALQSAAVVARVVAKRMLLFWAPSLEGYSLRHSLVNALTLGPLWLLALARLVWLFRHGATSLDRYLVALVVAYPIFHAFTMLDFDLRYRLPVLPFTHMLAAQALAARWPSPAAIAAHTNSSSV